MKISDWLSNISLAVDKLTHISYYTIFDPSHVDPQSIYTGSKYERMRDFYIVFLKITKPDLPRVLPLNNDTLVNLGEFSNHRDFNGLLLIYKTDTNENEIGPYLREQSKYISGNYEPVESQYDISGYVITSNISVYTDILNLKTQTGRFANSRNIVSSTHIGPNIHKYKSVIEIKSQTGDIIYSSSKEKSTILFYDNTLVCFRGKVSKDNFTGTILIYDMKEIRPKPRRTSATLPAELRDSTYVINGYFYSYYIDARYPRSIDKSRRVVIPIVDGKLGPVDKYTKYDTRFIGEEIKHATKYDNCYIIAV